MRSLALFIFSFVMATGLSAQCESWVNSPNKSEAEDAHVIYRPFVKNKDFQSALAPWQVAFDLAPVADGRRDDHFRAFRRGGLGLVHRRGVCGGKGAGIR